MAIAYPRVLLKDFLELFNGKSIKAANEGTYPVYGSNGRIGFAEEHKYKNAIILGRVGAYCGSVEYCPDRFWASDNTIVVKPKANVAEIRFLYYLLRDLDLHRHAGGAAQPLITQTTLKQVEAPLPPLPTQHKIASILSAYDDLIENNTRRIAILEEMAQAIYREWFVNFRFPGHENVKLVDSALGKIPEGWEPTTWGELATLEYGKRLLDYKDAEGPVPVYGTNGPIGFNDIALCDRAGVIIGRKGAYRGVEYSDVPFWVIDTAFYLNPTCDSVDIIWAYYKLLQLDINKMDSGSAIPSTSRDAFYAVPVVLPADKVVTEFRDIVDDLMLKCRVLHRKNHNLRTTRDLLLPKLISGQLDVEDLDIDAQKSFNGEPQA